ncbi:MAG: V-type ATP synthase subunit D [Candidatus Micrarchaeota archaeon]|nr:V-type ATP synthase subunit D [Candidatus Micrarchaeota archaeon]
MAENISPTRMELLNTRKKIKLAYQGHKLLKQKRDVLILEFFKILSKAKDLRAELAEQIKTAYRAVALAQAYHGVADVQNIAISLAPIKPVKIDVKNIMGIKIASVQSEEISTKPILERGYSLIGSSAKIDEAVEEFSKTLNLIIKLAEIENATRRLITEIEKTKRRVNALEFVLIPRLSQQEKLIQFQLEEMERDSFVMLKSIKRKLSSSQA